MARGNFDQCLDKVLAQEGGYSDHPADPGGATNLGITRKTLARWRGIAPFTDLPKSEVRALTRKEAAAIYKAYYWTPIGATALPKGLDLALFDFAVNSGPARAVKTLQTLLGVAPDGLLGPVTLKSIRARNQESGSPDLIRTLCARRLAFLKTLAAYKTFGDGWRARVAAIERTALQMTGLPTPSASKRTSPMTILSGYKTYIVALMMILTALAQIAGVTLPGFDGQSAAQLLLQGLAFVFLRRGISSTGQE